MNVRLLGAHNQESLHTRLSGVLIDGVLALDAGGLTSSLSFEEQQQLKVVLLTHQHYDHIRDLPALAINFYLAGTNIDVYATLPVSEIIAGHLFEGSIYPNYLKQPPENPTVRLKIVEPLKSVQINGYNVLPVPISHSVPSVGYQVTSPNGEVIFYTGDTGAGLNGCWKHISPRLLIVEVTASNRFEEFGKQSKHLAPSLLEQELIAFRKLKGYLPRIVTVHMSPGLENEIKSELAIVAANLDTAIEIGYEGMEIDL